MASRHFTTDPIDVIDADSHLTEPADLWVDRAPAALKDRVPRVVEDEDGRPHWVVEGKDLGNVSFTSIAPDGSRIHGETYAMPLRFDDVHKGAYDFRARLDWLDEHGISQQAIFPNLAGFGADRFVTDITDEALRTACVGIYNDAVAEIQQESGTRLLPLALVPWWDIDATIDELRRVRNTLGLRGITMCDAPHKFGLPLLDTPHWDRFWAECEELNLAIAFHIGSGSFSAQLWSQPKTGELLATQTANSFLSNSFIVSNLIFSGVLLKYPGLKIYSAETGIGWLPFFLEAMDYQWHENLYPEVQRAVWKQMLPSEIFRRNFFVSFWFEQFGPRYAIDAIGPDNVMFETDFPHGTALTDRVQDEVTSTLAAMSPDVRRRVLHDNAARLYDL
jgi:predicted TIM-barrel fold metal-dependent hydrolase